MGSRGSVSLIIPVYNGAAVIQATVETLVAHFAPRRPFELLMVNDGSTDRTGIVLAQCARRHSELRLIEWPRNRGKGAAVREGLLQARGELIGFCDADLPIAVAGLETMFQMLEADYDVAIASRVLQGSSVQSPPDPVRWLASRAFRLIVQRAFGLPFQDTQCGLKGFRRQAARSIGQRLCIDGFAFDVELLLVARQLRYRIGEFPVRVATVVLSTVNVPAHTGPIARELWRISRQLRRGDYGASDAAAERAGALAGERVEPQAAASVSEPAGRGYGHG